MTSALFWCLLVAGVGSSVAAPDFYSAWCPCKSLPECPVPYGTFFDDIAIFGQVPPCKKFGLVRCCSVSAIPEGFDLERPAVYLPRKVAVEAPSDRQQKLLSTAPADLQQNLLLTAGAPGTASAVRSLDLQYVQRRQDVIDFKAAQEKLKRDIASGIDNPNPPCGCYTEGTCPTRYATPSTGRDVGCLPGFDTCCFLDDPWPNYQVTNLTINAPCSVKDGCERFFGTSPFDISSFGPLEPCYLGQNRCLDYLQEGSNVPPTIVIVPTTKRPTTARRPGTTKRPDTTRKPFTTRPSVTTYRTTSQRAPTTYRTTTQRAPTTYRTTTQRAPTTYRTTTQRAATTYRTTNRQTQTTPYFFTTTEGPEPELPGEGSNIFINNAYLPPSRDFGSAAERAAPSGLEFQLPTF